MFSCLQKNTKDESEKQMKTLNQTILPRIALYKVLMETGFSKDEAYEHMRKYMIEIIGSKKHASMVKWN